MLDTNSTSTTQSSTKLYRERDTIKVGNTINANYQGIIIINPKNQISNTLQGNSLPPETNFSITKATLTLKTNSLKKRQSVLATMLPLNEQYDETVTWENSSEKKNILRSYVNTIQHSSENAYGQWNGNTVSFDITQYVSIWKSKQDIHDSFAVCILSNEPPFYITNEPLEFFSKNSSKYSLGGEEQKNCVFLKGGDLNFIDTDGIRVILTHQNGVSQIEYNDITPKSENIWNSIINSISIGNSFDFVSPDTEQNVILGNYTCTLLKTENQKMFVSGLTLPPNTQSYHTTAEFKAVSTVPEGIGLIEINNPSEKTFYDAKMLKTGDNISVEYVFTSPENNNKMFTVDYVLVEELKKNRIRIYTKEIPFSENRNGKSTQIITENNEPSIKLDLLVY